VLQGEVRHARQNCAKDATCVAAVDGGQIAVLLREFERDNSFDYGAHAVRLLRHCHGRETLCVAPETMRELRPSRTDDRIVCFGGSFGS